MSALISEPARPPRAREITAPLLFLDDGAAKPSVIYRPGASVPETDANYSARHVAIRDARPNADHLKLDGHGFKLVSHTSSVRDFTDDGEAGGLGREEAADIVAVATGASHVFVFDHTRRRSTPDAIRQPSARIHVDYTTNSAPQRLRDFFGAAATDAALRKRVAFINVWRPIRRPAENWPLALAYAHSVAPEDLIATDLIYPDRRGEIYGLRYNPRQRWGYIPSMQLDEALLIKCYDSRTDVARFTPHTAFADPDVRRGAPPRESIEFRTIAFFD